MLHFLKYPLDQDIQQHSYISYEDVPSYLKCLNKLYLILCLILELMAYLEVVEDGTRHFANLWLFSNG